MKKISIIVPVYNVEKYIGGCIESILSQSYSNWELLLLDDESSDKSVEICKKYAEKDERIKVFQKKHLGVSAIRNLGIELAKGQYITFIDSDDQIEIDFLQKAIDICMKKHVEIYMAGCRGIEEEREVAIGVIGNNIYSNSRNFTEEQLIELLEQNYTATCWSKLFLKEKIGETRFEKNCVFGEDLMFVHELLKKKRYCFCRYLYRIQLF